MINSNENKGFSFDRFDVIKSLDLLIQKTWLFSSPDVTNVRMHFDCDKNKYNVRQINIIVLLISE